VTYATYHLEGAASSWWENYLNMRPEGPPTTWNEFGTAFREHHIPKGLMDRKREEFCNLTQGRRTVDEYSREFNRLAVMQLKKSPPTPRSRKGSAEDFTQGSAVSLTFMTLPHSRSLSTRPLRQRI